MNFDPFFIPQMANQLNDRKLYVHKQTTRGGNEIQDIYTYHEEIGRS